MAGHSDLMHDGALIEPDDSSDKTNSVSSEVIRCVYEGQRAVAVGAERKPRVQIAALLDLLDLHLAGNEQRRGVPVEPHNVTVLLGGRPRGRREALDALTILTDVLARNCAAPKVRLLEHTDGGWHPPSDSGWEVTDPTPYKSFPALLEGVADDAPGIVKRLVELVDEPSLRAYPMLTKRGHWSIRLEGLQIAEVSERGGTLSVGKDADSGRQSIQRQAWITSQGGIDDPIKLDSSDESVNAAATAIRAFRDHWRSHRAFGAAKQDEHALESRILRGAAQVEIAGKPLDLLRAPGVVNWGSQFPTLWGRDGRARYLDALLRDGATPWAVEIKVQGGGGVGRYYRHAVAQAVLYREFIRAATPLHPWFERQRLVATDCRAAVVIPRLSASGARWRPRLDGLCELFEVELVEVEPTVAQLDSP